MREIKFRGKDEWKNWRYGDLMKNSIPTTSPVIVEDFYYDDPDDSMFEVDPDTVGQFTGLTDADGREIFEGDILRYTRDTGVVFWNNAECRWCIEMGDGEVFILASRNAHFWHVVGNIYDSPDLLTYAKD